MAVFYVTEFFCVGLRDHTTTWKELMHDASIILPVSCQNLGPPMMIFVLIRDGITAAFSPDGRTDYSHSIVPGGLLVTSYTTRLTPFTSLMMRVATAPMNFMSKG